MRIDKLLCEMNIASRKDLKELIRKGNLCVNGNVVKDPGFNVNETSDVIEFKGKTISYEKFVYFMLNKPAGVVSATNDNTAGTVIDLLKDENKKDLFPVGRLDKDTTGLLIITNDGELGHKLTSPKHHAAKEYLVGLRDNITADSVKQLEDGVVLDGDGLTKPAKVTLIDDKTIILEIYEGKFHQVKRMLLAVSNEVVSLKRLSMGGLELDDSLKEGEYRRLTEEEIDILKGGTL